PNDILLNGTAQQLVVLTGPNMGGKSTYLRQTALLCVMAQAGSFVPAREAKLPIVDRIFARVGASDNIARGHSTFMVEMQETANILHHASSRSLVVLDEIGRGTATFDGLSIAWAVAEYLATNPRGRPKTLFATHYHELTDLADATPGVVNYHVSAREWKDDIIFLRKIVPGRSDRSYGIQVARLAGLPKTVIDRARDPGRARARRAHARRTPVGQRHGVGSAAAARALPALVVAGRRRAAQEDRGSRSRSHHPDGGARLSGATEEGRRVVLPVVRPAARAALIVLAAAVFATQLRAATIFDPALRFRTLTTDHFVISFHQDEADTAGRLAAIAEDTWRALQSALAAPPPRRTQVVLVDQTDLANGYATPIPYDTVVIYETWPAGSEFIGNVDDWLRVAFTHEFTHVVHLDRSGGWARVVRGVFGRTTLAFPNLFLPTWQVEGLATYEESAITGLGRVHAGDFAAVVDEAARAGAAEPIDRVNGGLTDWPAGNGPYAYGAGFHEYLARRFGA